MTTLSGRSTAITRGARLFRSSRRQSSSQAMSISAVELGDADAARRTCGSPRACSRAGGSREIVGMRGSSQPLTCFSCTSSISLRLLSIV